MKIRKKVNLAPYTTFKIGGPADYFCVARSKGDLVKAVNWAQVKKIDYLVLGGGSNVLISDKGVRGLVIKMQTSKLKLQNNEPEYEVAAEAGVELSRLIQYAAENSLTGLEALAGIPGTVGGAIVGNAGTPSGSIGQILKRVIVLAEDGLIYNLDSKECQFQYRQSRFQKTREIILKAKFRLGKAEKPAIMKKMNKALAMRKNQPQGLSAGSIFKNPEAKPAGYLIDNSGLKGAKSGGAVISRGHANWIINKGKAKASDVLKLINLVEKKVKEKYSLSLEREIRLIGEF